MSTDEHARRDETTRRDDEPATGDATDDPTVIDDTRRPKRYPSASAIDAMLERAAGQGEFDDLPGKGRPIPNLDPNDRTWWLRAKLEREGVSVAPEPLRIRREIERTIEALWALDTEERVRGKIAEINLRIRALNQLTAVGPTLGMVPFDVDELLQRWRQRRAGADDA